MFNLLWGWSPDVVTIFQVRIAVRACTVSLESSSVQYSVAIQCGQGLAAEFHPHTDRGLGHLSTDRVANNCSP